MKLLASHKKYVPVAGCCFLLIVLSVSSYAQPSDFIILKKGDKTIKSYFAGTQIEFVTTNNVYKNAVIKRVHNDSLFIQEFIVRTVMTQMGFYVTDTLGSYSYAYNYRDIKYIGKKQKGFNVQGSGAALLGGGILLTVASGVVYLADRKKFSPWLMGGGAGLAGIGYLLTKLGGHPIVIGKKKYRLEYMKVSP